MKARPVFERLLEGIETDPITGCWNWQKSCNARGYGTIWNNGSDLTHRVSYRLHCGEIPDGLSVMHRCDNPQCCNPEHLTVGTKGDNNLDRHRKGRSATGEGHGKAQLTLADVQNIRASDEPRRVLADRYGVCKAHITRIRTGKFWKMAA